MSPPIFPSLQAGWRRFWQHSLLLGTLLLSAHAHADLMLHPTRIVFEKNQRANQVELINNGSETAIFRISVVNRRMSETGQFLPITQAEPGELFAEPMVRYSPRQVTLQPGTSQTVRIMLRKPAELADGEYRSHLQFEKLPPANGSTSVESKGGDDKEIGVVVQALVGASIPVIVRHGATSASVRLTQLALVKTETGPALSLQFERGGNRSVYGDLEVAFAPNGGAEQALARIGGIAVYTPNPIRKVMVTLQPPPGLTLAHGTLQVRYRDRPEAGAGLLAQASLVLP